MRALKNLLFPSWGFFARYDEFPMLMLSSRALNRDDAALSDGGAVLSGGDAVLSGGDAVKDEWFPVLQPRPWRWVQIFVNTHENLRLARLDVLLSLIDSLNGWEGDPSQIRALKSYQGLLSVCSQELRGRQPEAKEFRFKIVQPSKSGDWEDVFVSAVEEIVWRF